MNSFEYIKYTRFFFFFLLLFLLQTVAIYLIMVIIYSLNCFKRYKQYKRCAHLYNEVHIIYINELFLRSKWQQHTLCMGLFYSILFI